MLHTDNTERFDQESGVVMLTMLTTLVPLLLIVGAFTAVMSSRSAEQRQVLDEERALMAAESGIDDAIYRGQIGTLADGQKYQRDLSGGMSFTVTATHLGSDGADNDTDGSTDETDEDVFQVIAEGTYRNSTRRLAAYLGPTASLPTLSMTGAMAIYNPSININLGGTPDISGNDLNIDGTSASTTNYGMTIASPGTVADLSSTISKKERSKISGLGGSPSLGTAAAEDLASITASIQNSANLVLTSNHYSGKDMGSGASGVSNIIYRNGDVKFSGGSGAGVMLVTGDLTITGNYRFDGVIIVLGSIKASGGTADVYGGVIMGPASSEVYSRGTLGIHYSSEGLGLANNNSGSYVSFNGWQELAR